ncbi:MAG: alpha/beta hydrolase [Terricaulis sp.]
MPVCQMRDGARLTYAEDGAGPPVLLVHGWAAHGGFFRDLQTRLAAHYRVIAPTLRGHPGSDRGTLPLCIETLADDLVTLTEALGLESIVALGWSMGAMALWAAAPRLGGRLAGLIIEDMSPRLVNDAGWRFGLSGYAAADVYETLKEIGADWPAHVSRFAPRMFAPGARASDGRQIDWAIAEMSKAEPSAMASLWSSMAAQDFRAALLRIQTPMLTLHGAESQVYPDGASAFIAHTAPHAQRIAVAGAGHVPHLEAPDAFFEQVAAFVHKVRQSNLIRGGVQ